MIDGIFLIALVRGIAIKTQEANEVANLLYKENFTRYGAPRTLACDRGQHLMKKIVPILCKIVRLPDISQVHIIHKVL